MILFLDLLYSECVLGLDFVVNPRVNLERLEGAPRVRALSRIGVTNRSDFCETVHLYLVSLFVLTGAQCNKG